MKTPHVLARSIFALIFALLLASAGAQAQVTELRPTGSGDSNGGSSGFGPVSVITDDSDPFGNRFGVFPRPPSEVMWRTSGATAGSSEPEVRLQPLPIVLVIDPVTGAVVGIEREGVTPLATRPGTIILGPDGFFRIALPVQPMRRR